MRFAKLALALITGCGAFAQGPGYGGPAILSRGQLPGTQQRSGLFNIRPFVSVNGTYDVGLTGLGLDSQGDLLNASSYGAQARAGVTGYRSWKQSRLGLDYEVFAHHYSTRSNFDGVNQTLSLNYDRRLTRHVELNVQEAAGIGNRAFGIVGGSEFVNSNLVTIPSNEIFASRVYYQSTYSTVSFQMSRRFSFSAGGSQFVVQRHAPILVSGHGYGAYGDMAYRVNKTSSLVFFYNFGHFAYARSFGAADFHMVGLGYAKQIGRYWQLSISGGVNRIEVQSLTLVPIDPIIAAIIGQSAGVQVAYHLNYLPAAQASLTRAFRRSALGLSYTEGLSPGNGVYLASRTRSGSASYTYSGFRKWSLGARVDYTRYRDLSRSMGAYESYGGSGNASYRLARSVFFSLGGDVRDYRTGSAFSRRGYRATAGLTWSPGDYPISFK